MSSLFLDTNYNFICLDSFLPFMVPRMDDSLHIIVSDFNHLSEFALSVSDLNALSISPTRGNSILDRIIANHPELFCPKLRTPVSTSDHCWSLLEPMVYSHINLQSFKESSQIKIRLRTFSVENTFLLKSSLFHVSW